MMTVENLKNSIDQVLKDNIRLNRTYRELIVQILQLSNYKVDSREYIKLLAVYSDKRFLREIKKILGI